MKKIYIPEYLRRGYGYPRSDRHEPRPHDGTWRREIVVSSDWEVPKGFLIPMVKEVYPNLYVETDLSVASIPELVKKYK